LDVPCARDAPTGLLGEREGHRTDRHDPRPCARGRRRPGFGRRVVVTAPGEYHRPRRMTAALGIRMVASLRTHRSGRTSRGQRPTILAPTVLPPPTTLVCAPARRQRLTAEHVAIKIRRVPERRRPTPGSPRQPTTASTAIHLSPASSLDPLTSAAGGRPPEGRYACGEPWCDPGAAAAILWRPMSYCSNF